MHINELKKKYLRLSIYDLTIGFLLIMGGGFVYSSGLLMLQQILIVTLTAMIFEEAIYYFKNRETFIPKSAIIIGLIISLLILSEPLWIQITIPAIAVALKYVLRYKNRPIFNPTALALVIGIFLLGTNVVWAGAAIPLAFLGFIIAHKIRRLNLALSFLVIYYVTNFILSTHHLPKIYFPSAIAVFFATVMLIDPRTSPQSKYGMIIFGVVAALLANALTHFGSPADPLLAALLIANMFTNRLNKI